MTTSYSLRKGLDARTPSLLPRDLSRCSSEEARKLIPFDTAAARGALPLGFVEQYGERTLTIAVSEPTAERKKELRFLTGFEVRLVEVSKSVLDEAVFLAYRGHSSRVEDAASKAAGTARIRPITGGVGLRDVDTPENELLCSLLDYALAMEATDLHFTPRENGLFVSIRTGGEIRSRDTKLCSADIYGRMIQRIKVLSRLDITAKNRAQEGVFTIPLYHGNTAARVSIIPTIHGESIALRFMKRSGILTLAELGLAPESLEALRAVAKSTSGLYLFSGATGSGKTTSLYALTDALARESLRIASVEDPVECIVPWMTQTQINPEKGLTFETALKALLRHDPDVIMIGEIRESAAATIAVNAALTGHIVLSSVHAGSVSDTLARILSLGVDEKMLRQALRMITYQERAPAPCKSCGGCGCAECDETGAGREVLFAEVAEFAR